LRKSSVLFIFLTLFFFSKQSIEIREPIIHAYMIQPAGRGAPALWS